jgi:alkylation response protein AidB-like acyl-CoA dehydrogenase
LEVVSGTGLDLSYDDAQQAIADRIAAYCCDHCTPDAARAAADRFPAALWKQLAELGVLGLATPEGVGGALEVAAAMESLGGAAHPGPLVETFFATQVLPADDRARVAAGELVAAVGAPPIVAWAPCAQRFVEVAGGTAWLAEADGPVEPVATLGGDPAGRVRLARRAQLGATDRAQALADLAAAAYLAAAGRTLVAAAADHARVRKQFGRAIGSFQAVAHPLADAVIALDAAATLARVAAWEWDERDPGAGTRAAAARLSASRAAERAAHAAHQAFGALGVMRDGPAFFASRRILQLVATPFGDARAALAAALGLA